MIDLTLLGGVRLTGGDPERLTGLLAQPKRVALLAYLTLARPRGFQSRDTLLALFWPELDGRHARWALNQAVRHLRQALGGDVVRRRGKDVGIDPAQLGCDATALEAACATGQWAEALALYTDDLLAGLALGGAAELDQWLDGERERLRGLAAGAASARAEELLAAGDLAGAARFAREAVRLAPDDEPRVRRLIELLSAAGDRAGALRAYDDYAARLRGAGDFEPAPETRSLIAALRAGNKILPPVPQRPAAAADLREGAERAPAHLVSGPVRAHPPRFARLGAAAAVLVAAAVLGAVGLTLGLRRARVAVRPRVLVTPFENLTGNAALDPIGRAVGGSVVDGLAELGTLEVLPVGAAGENATFTVSGSYRLRGDSLEFVTEIVDQLRHRALPAPEPARAPLGDPSAGADIVSQRAAGAMGYYTGVFGAPATPERRPPSYPAYTAFVQGLRFLQRGEPESVEVAMHHVLELDPTYTEAYHVLGGVVSAMEPGPAARRGGRFGRPDALDSLAKVMRAAIHPLTDADRYLLEVLDDRARGDAAAGLVAFTRLVDWMPSAVWGVAAQAEWMNRPRIAVDRLRHSRQAEVLWVEFPNYWWALTSAYHELGDYEQEHRAADAGLQRFPGSPALGEARLRAALALGASDEVDAAIPRLPAFPALRLAMEARFHGQAAEARRLLARALDASEQGASERAVDTRYARAIALSLLGRESEAIDLLKQLVQRDTARLDFKGMLGVVYGKQGNRAVAARISRELAAVREPDLWGLPALWRARIAAVTGDSARAVALLQEALAEGTLYVPAFMPGGSFWHSDPAFESLRNYAPYQALIRPR